MSLKGKTLFITGGSRGIGLAIALKAAADGANVAIAAKTVEPHPKLEGTIHTAAAAIEKAGGQALPLAGRRPRGSRGEGGNRRDRGEIRRHRHRGQQCQRHPAHTGRANRHAPLRPDARDQCARHLHGVEICPALSRQGGQPAHPDAVAAARHADKWFAPHTAYSMAKFGMSLVVLGLAGEQRGKIAVNALWPRTTIATAAIKNLLGGDAIMRMSRKPEILAEAAYRIFHKPKSFTGNFLIDDTFLAGEGVTDFDQYRADPSQPLQVDFFVPDSMPPPAGVSLKAKA